MNTHCTWKDCDADGAHEMTGKHGQVWAFLCDEHHQEFEATMERFSPKGVIRVWALASGGRPLTKPYRHEAAG